MVSVVTRARGTSSSRLDNQVAEIEGTFRLKMLIPGESLTHEFGVDA